MKDITLIRKRFVPEEEFELKKDIILFASKDMIITKWDCIKKRADFDSGVSIYYLKKGYKVSQFFKDKKLIYTYCDIINAVIEGDKYIIEDLLADVIIYPDGFVKVVDIKEIADCISDNTISIELAKKALIRLDKLLKEIYKGNLETLLKPLEDYDYDGKE